MEVIDRSHFHLSGRLLDILFNNPGDNSHCNIPFFINMCHNKGHLIFLPNGAAVVATVSNGVDAQF